MALPDYPITRNEQYLSAIAGEETTLPDYPITRSEQYLNKIATGEGETPDFPITREEQYLDYIAEHGGGGDITVEPLTATENGTYNPGSGKAYKPVTVNVPVPASQEELDSIAEGIGVETPSTPESIESAVEGLIEDANEATGESDTNLTDAVGTLIAGQGSGSAQIPFTTQEIVVIGANDITMNHEVVDYFYPSQVASNQLIIISPDSAVSTESYQLVVLHHFHASSAGEWVGGSGDYMLVITKSTKTPYAPSTGHGRSASIPEGSKYIIYTFGKGDTT